MVGLTEKINKFSRYGVGGSLKKGYQAAELEMQALWTSFQSRRLPGDREMLRQLDGDWKDLEQFANYLAGKGSPADLFPLETRQSFSNTLIRKFPDYVEKVLTDNAEAICKHRFHFLGKDIGFNNEIDWNLDPSTGQHWPLMYFKKFSNWLWSGVQVGDLKYTAELNRHQWFVTLGVAYWLSNNERYSLEFSNQVNSWIKANPYGMGPNWYSALELGIRLISWGVAFMAFKNSPAFITQAAKPFLKCIYLQAKFLKEHLTVHHKVPNNHIIGEVCGLIFISALFPEFHEAAEWQKTGLAILEKQLSDQVDDDGASREQAIGYQRFVVDFVLLVTVLARRGAFPLAPMVERRLQKMIEYLMLTRTPSGDYPQVGDADDGRGLLLDESAQYWDFSETLAIGAVLFNRADFKNAAGHFSVGAFFLLGEKGLEVFDQIGSYNPRATSTAFPQVGQYIIRQSWEPDSDYAFIKSGPFGLGGEGYCAHAHCDLLSPVIYMDGRPFLVDSGTFSYHGEWRSPFRLTTSHNTLMIDGVEQAQPVNDFAWKDVPLAEVISWDGLSLVGALQYKHNIRHERSITLKSSGRWQVIDLVHAFPGIHHLEWHFHFAPALSLDSSQGSQSILAVNEGKPFAGIFSPSGVSISTINSWYSKNYGIRQPASVLHGNWQGEIPQNGIRFTWEFFRMNSFNYPGSTDI
jgi:hypothetical protein